MKNDYLEDEFREPYETWKADMSPAANAAMLKTLDPAIRKGIQTHVGEPTPLMLGRGRRLALEGLRSYDPSRARLQTHMFNQLQGLKRIARQQGQVISVPERVIFDKARLDEMNQELQDKLGREPTDSELANRTGFSQKRITHVRRFVPGMTEGQLSAVDPGLSPGLAAQQSARDMWVEMVYDELPPLDQKILEWSIGMHGRKPLSNMEIAKKLGRSAGAISQRKLKIQELLDKEEDLSPFLG